MYHDASTAVLLDLRRWFKAVRDLLLAVIRGWGYFGSSLELTVQWDGILRIGPVFPLTMQDFDMARSGLGGWLQVVEGLHRGLSDFIHRVVVHRREEALRGWRNWLREDPLVHPYKWLRPDLVHPALSDCSRWSCGVTQPVGCSPLWLAALLPAVYKSRNSKSVEVQRVREIYDDQPAFHGTGNLSRLVLGRGVARLRVVRIGGPQVRKVRGNAVDPVDGKDVHMYRDSSIAPLLDLGHRLKVAHDVLVEMVRNGFSLARSLELAAQWDCVLRAGPMHPISAEDLMRVQDGGLGWFREVVGGLHDRLSDLIQGCCPTEG